MHNNSKKFTIKTYYSCSIIIEENRKRIQYTYTFTYMTYISISSLLERFHGSLHYKELVTLCLNFMSCCQLSYFSELMSLMHLCYFSHLRNINSPIKLCHAFIMFSISALSVLWCTSLIFQTALSGMYCLQN